MTQMALVSRGPAGSGRRMIKVTQPGASWSFNRCGLRPSSATAALLLLPELRRRRMGGMSRVGGAPTLGGRGAVAGLARASAREMALVEK